MTKPKKQRQTQIRLIDVEPDKGDKFAREADKIILAEVMLRQTKYKWSNEGEAFAHLFTQFKFDLDEDEAAQACIVGRAGHDHGIDAYYLDDHAMEGGTLYIVQTKANRVEHDEGVLWDDVKKAVKFLEGDKIEGAKSTLGEVLELYRDAIKKKYNVIFVLGLNGDADKVKNSLSDYEQQLPSHCQVEIFDVDDIRALVMRPKHLPPNGPTVKFEKLPNIPWELKTSDATPKIITCAVPAYQLGAFVHRHRLAIFRLNVREYLGQKNPVNRIVQESLKKEPEKFHYLNLGIDAVCDSYKVDVIPELENPNSCSLTIVNFQIVNGCQTAKTISELDVDRKALVMLRLIQVAKDERTQLVPEISVAKNRQSPIRGRDLFAWDNSQTRLQKEFEKLGYFFETREKEWDAINKHQAKTKSLYPNGRLENTELARAYLAIYLQQPFRAKHRKKDFFQHEQDGGAFEEIFKDTEAEEMLLAWKMYKYVVEKCKQAGKDFRELASRAESNVLSENDEYRLEETNVIWNGDTFIAGLMGFYINSFYDLNISNDHDLGLTVTQQLLKQISTTKELNKVLGFLYDQARETVTQAYMLRKRPYKKESLFTPRRFYYQEETYQTLKDMARAKNMHVFSSVLKPLRK